MDDAEKKLEEYIERYCMKHHCTPEEARKHALVNNIEKYYKNEDAK